MQPQIVVEHATGSNLVQVVILSIHPEHGHHLCLLVGGNLAGQLDGRDSFEQREKRSPKETGLLTRHHSNRVWPSELFGRSDRLRRRGSGIELCGDQSCKTNTVRLFHLLCRDNLSPRGS